MEFTLDKDFVKSYKNKPVNFGFNGLGEIAFIDKYSRVKDNGENELWHETCERVVNGTFSMQKRHIQKHDLGWDEVKAQDSAQEMFDRMFAFKWLPPGRGLWAMGTAITEERGLFAALNNCAFVSMSSATADDPSKPFAFLMDMSMLGVGVGFDTKKPENYDFKVHPNVSSSSETYVIPDSREGWVEAVRKLINSWLIEGHPVFAFDYSEIRPEGAPIKTFGGVAPGPEPLKELIESLDKLFENRIFRSLTTRDIVDIMNMIGKCVVSGNIRRTAEIALGDYDDQEFLDLKNYKKNPERASYGWTSNNSVICNVGDDYSDIADRIRDNGEPGILWLDNARKYSRMRDPVDNKDHRASGTNPCGEQTLESYELCCLVETFPEKHNNIDDYIRTLKFAYLYAKTVTLGKTHWPETNRVMLRNRRIGTSMSGIVQAEAKFGINQLVDWMEDGYEATQEYDEIYSDWLCIPRSIKITSVKPSGTVSLLAGATPGVHYPQSRHYIRRVRVQRSSELLDRLAEAGYTIEPDVVDDSSVVVEVPVSLGDNVRTLNEVTIHEQFKLASLLQRHWADNQVSVTVTFDPETEGKFIEPLLNVYQRELKSISLLPIADASGYAQMPYEAITKKRYEEMASKITDINLYGLSQDSTPEKFCDGDFCEI